MTTSPLVRPVLNASPTSNAYAGARIHREHGDVYIEIGPHLDGDGYERFHVLSGQLTAEQLAAGERPRGRMHGGFVLGRKCSGKSALTTEIADGLRALGIEIWHMDPLRGMSSSALNAEADWPLAGLHRPDDPFANVADLWKAAKAVTELRAAEGAPDHGFQHTRRRPAIMIIVDECQAVFNGTNSETGNSFGEDFADLDREMNRNGLALLGASPSITLGTFGRGSKAAALRDSLCATNMYVMSYGASTLPLAPGYDGQPCALLPTGQGYGYNFRGERPQAVFQARYTNDFGPWLASHPKATLDAPARASVGAAYRRQCDARP